jgi:hypothetical protein|tara:strand:- start:396 stop:851 length:456 start_codon:yes stop_codon:yes gene_type:complete
MKHVYDILDTLKTELRANPSVNTVTDGDITEVDLDKTTMFPLSHIIIRSFSPTSEARTLKFMVSILCADIVDYNIAPSNFDEFYGNNNQQDVLNTQAEVINSLSTKMIRGSLFKNKYRISNSPVSEIFKDGGIIGWTTDIEIEVPNNISTC